MHKRHCVFITESGRPSSAAPAAVCIIKRDGSAALNSRYRFRRGSVPRSPRHQPRFPVRPPFRAGGEPQINDLIKYAQMTHLVGMG